MDRLWTPWRYAYIAEAKVARFAGVPEALQEFAPEVDRHCVFCNMLATVERAEASGIAAEEAERKARILHRGRLGFACLNIFPYSSGHVLLVPYDHVDSLTGLSAEGAEDLMRVARDVEGYLREEYRPDGVNLGMNLGEAAGAGVADHLHLHILPRWTGDGNFMTVVGETRVLPEDLDMTWRRLRGYFERI